MQEKSLVSTEIFKIFRGSIPRTPLASRAFGARYFVLNILGLRTPFNETQLRARRIHLKYATVDVQLDDRQVSTASGTLRQTKTAIESTFFSVDCPWVEQPTRPSRIAYSVETFRAQLAQEIGIAALTSRSHYYYDWDDCWPPVPHIPCGSFAQNRFRFTSQHLSTESVRRWHSWSDLWLPTRRSRVQSPA